jgi:radical SAM superfamily enzyme YgiQ (UPF0313 family)
MYKGKKFRIRPVEEIKDDITSARMHFGEHVHTVFLADGNSIIMKTPQLLEIINYCYAVFPNLERVTSYGSAKFVLKTKTVKDLKQLQKAGLKRLHMGLESGDDAVLEKVCKGATADQMVEASNMVKEAGIKLSQYVLLGVAGKNGWKQHAVNTAKVLNEMDPDFIRVRTLILKEGAPLYEDFQNGEFQSCSPEEILEETQVILENLDVTSQFYSDHVSNYANINGKLPDEKAQMLEELQNIQDRLEKDPEFKSWLLDPMRCLNL